MDGRPRRGAVCGIDRPRRTERTAVCGGGAHAVRCGLEFFGADHVVFATDTPLGPIAPTIARIKELDISSSDRQKIFFGNAEQLLKRKLS